VTVFFNKARRRWMYNFFVAGRRHQGYCINPDGSHAQTQPEALRAELFLKASRGTGTPPPHLKGFIYFAITEDNSFVKIGWSRTPKKRLKGISTSGPMKVSAIGLRRGTVLDEKHLHLKFADYRVNGEWFRAAPELLDAIAFDITAAGAIQKLRDSGIIKSSDENY